MPIFKRMPAIRVPLFGLIAVMALLAAETARAQGDGPRAYQLLPEDTKVIALYGIHTQGNETADTGTVVRGSQIDVSLGVVQYIHTIALGKRQAALFGILPFGKVDGSIDLTGRSFSGSSSGIGDLQLGSVIGLIGSPSLPLKEYAAYNPGFTLAMLGKLFLPTGEYDATKVLNLGANRFAGQLGVLMIYYLGTSFQDASLTSFELMPSVYIYGDNDNPYNADKREQAPLFRVEGHITRNLNKMIWLSADALYTYGGETTTDGVRDGNTQRALMLGCSANFTMSSASLKLSTGKTVMANDSGPDGWMIRAILNFAF